VFETPTVAALSAKIESLIRKGSTLELPRIVPVRRDGPLPLSINQEHLWYLDRMFPAFHFFNMSYVYRLSGSLDIAALQKAIQEIFRRHEALRTVFGRADEALVQIIKEYSAFQLSMVDLRSGDPDAVSEKAADIMLTERTQPFDLALGPLLRIKLLRLTDVEYLLPVTMHHIIGDQWSMRIFRNELSALYESYSQGRSTPLPAPRSQYADYACWERRLLKDDLFKRQLDYWKKRLAGSMLEPQFKRARKRTQRITFRTKRLPLEFEGNLFSDIKKLARVENDTPFIIVLAALNILLHRWTGQRDIRIGTLVANRARKESEQVIGHFVNTVILRNRLGPSMTVHQLIAQVGKVFREALANQELPFEHLARVLERERKIRRTSLFRVMFMYHKPSLEVLNLPGITFASLGWQHFDSDADLTLTACDLVVNMREMETKITGSVIYKTDIFGNDVVAAMVNQLIRILKRMVVDAGSAATSSS
jgi:Condensation domain